MNSLLAGSYKVGDDRLPAPENTPSTTGKTDQPVYKQGCKWNDIYHGRESFCQLDAVKLDGTTKEFIIVLTYLTAFVFFLSKPFFDEVNLVETNRRIKGPVIDFLKFLQFIGIWLLMKANPITNQEGCFRKKL